jgi:hypothetical protein
MKFDTDLVWPELEQTKKVERVNEPSECGDRES